MEAQEFLICLVEETQIPADEKELEVMLGPGMPGTVRMCCIPCCFLKSCFSSLPQHPQLK